MGYEKIKRPLLAPGIAVVSGEAAPSAGSAVGDVLTPSGSVVQEVETVTSTAVTLSGRGLTLLVPPSTLAGDMAFKLASPAEAGVIKDIAVNTPTASTFQVSIVLATTALTFFGTTMNAFSLSTAGDGPSVTLGLKLVGASTASWAIVGRTTGWTLGGSTLP